LLNISIALTTIENKISQCYEDLNEPLIVDGLEKLIEMKYTTAVQTVIVICPRPRTDGDISCFYFRSK
jgi:hypothetical protein